MLGLGLGINRFRYSGNVSYIPEAQALFDEVSGIPEAAKIAANNLITTAVNLGIWDDPSFKLAGCLPCDNHPDYFIEWKSLVRMSEPLQTTATPYTYPYNSGNNRGGQKGFMLSGATQYVKTGWIDSDIFSDINANGQGIITYHNIALRAQYITGAFVTPNSNLIAPRYTGNVVKMDSFRVTSTGTYSAASDGNGTLYYINRQSATDVKIIKERSVIGSFATIGGGLPNIEDYIGVYNSAGAPFSTRFSTTNVCVKFKVPALSDSDALVWANALCDYQEAMEFREDLYNKNLIFSGNSHLVFQWAKQVRASELALFGNGWDIRNFGISGQTTAQMIVGDPAKIDGLYNAGYSKNILIAFEIQNDASSNGFAAAYTNIQTYCAARRAAGFEVIVCQIPAREPGSNYDGYTAQQWDQATSDINVLIRDNWSSFADGFIEAPIEVFDYAYNYPDAATYTAAMLALRMGTAFGADNLHLSELGYQLYVNKYLQLIPTM